MPKKPPNFAYSFWVIPSPSAGESQQDKTFAARLELILSERLRRKIRTVNSGVGGYNTVQELAFLRKKGDLIEPDFIVLLYVPNDVEVNSPPFEPELRVSLQGKSPPESVKIILGKSWSCRLVYHFVQFHNREAGEPPTDSQGWKDSMASVKAIAAYCRERRLPFVTFVARRKHCGAIGERVWEDLSQLAAEEGFPVVDVKPWWGEVEWHELRNSVVDSHPNARGHELLARGMEAFLIDKTGLLPKSLPPVKRGE